MNRQPEDGSRQSCRIDAAGVADARGLLASPASLLLEQNEDGWRVLALGTPGEVDSHPLAATAVLIERARSLLVPGLVNAHAHLDLTHMGPQDYDPAAGFAGWIERVMAQRLDEEDRIAASVRRGIELIRAGGTVAVGDIAGSPLSGPSLAPFRELRDSGLAGVSFLEFFAIGRREAGAIERVEAILRENSEELAESGRVRFGLQPHAPNTVSPRAYHWSAERAFEAAWPLSTHLAETAEEREFVGEASGPQRALLERLGLWEEGLLEAFGHARTPIGHLEEVLGRGRWVIAHANDASDADIEILARTETSVAYCPRASEYFSAASHFGAHRYLEMLDAGVNVALGTDSIVNLGSDAADPERGGISILDEMRRLYARDGTDPARLLAMGTINGASALGLDPAAYLFEVGGVIAGVGAVELKGEGRKDPLVSMLGGDGPIRLIEVADGAVGQE